MRTPLTSPVILARTKTILKVMEAIGIPHNDFSLNYLRNVLDGTTAVTTHPQIFEDVKCSTRRCADQANCNCQLLTVMTQTQHPVTHTWYLGHILDPSFVQTTFLVLHRFQLFVDALGHLL
jgi:hypothetical protein